MKIAFVVGIFPAASMTWMINQVADLLDRGFEIDIYAFNKGDEKNSSDRYREYNMASRTKYIGMPSNKLIRVVKAAPKIIKLLFVSPKTLFNALNLRKYGSDALSLKLVFWCEKFPCKKYDLIHLHEGHIANQFLLIKDIVGIDAKIITSFYGLDVSKVFKEHEGEDIYKRLKKESSAFIVMSNNMKERIVAHGFDGDKIHVIPISVDVKSYPFTERRIGAEDIFQIVSVGRFVEKKGFDDLLRALAIVKKKAKRKFMCNIIGNGPLRDKLYKMTRELGLQDVVSYKGFMKIEDIIDYYKDMHLYLQPSKTARDGDME